MNRFLIETLTDSSLPVHLGWALVHFLWQGVLVGVIAAVLLRLTPRDCVNLRYRISCGGMLLMAVCPLLTLAWSLSSPGRVPTTYIAAQQFSADVDIQTPTGGDASRGQQASTVRISELQAIQSVGSSPDGTPYSPTHGLESTPVGDSVLQRRGAEPLSVGAASQADGSQASAWSGTLLVQQGLAGIALVWAIGVGGLTIRLLGGLGRVRSWSRASQPMLDSKILQRLMTLTDRLGIKSMVRLRVSEVTVVPQVIGSLRPIILVPSSLLSGLTPAELDAILAHELAHVRRKDFMVNLLQIVAETLLFYHPVVWWLSRQVRIEREHCCDDLAAEACGDRRQLARALAQMETLRCKGHRLAPAATGGMLVRRIRRLIGEEQPQPIRRWDVYLVAMIMLSTAALGSFALRWTYAQDPVADSTPVQTSRSNVVQSIDENSDSDLTRSTSQPDVEAGESQSSQILRETVKVDSVTQKEQRVFAGIQLSGTVPDGRAVSDTLAMKYSGALPYSIITEEVARNLNATVLGVMDFGEPPRSNPIAYQTLILADEAAEAGATEVAQEVESEAKENTAYFHEVENPDASQRIIPYENTVWFPGYLATYGMNRTDQREFEVVRIDKVDLGIGAQFGPVNALVLKRENSDFGVLAKDWLRRCQGADGESLWFTFDGTLRLAKPRPVEEPSPPVNRPNGDADEGLSSSFEVGGSDVPDAHKEKHVHPRTLRPEFIEVAFQDFRKATRTTQSWLEVEGQRVPVDQGVEAAGVVIHLSLFSDVIAVDQETKKVLWQRAGGKNRPTWNVISIVTDEQGDRPVVELFSADELRRRAHFLYLDLKTGDIIETDGENPGVSLLNMQMDPRHLPQTLEVLSRNGLTPTHVRVHSRQPEQTLWSQDGIDPRGMSETEIDNSRSDEVDSVVIMSAEAGEEFDGRIEASNVSLQLPRNSKLQIEFRGESVEMRTGGERTQVVITDGSIELFDASAKRRVLVKAKRAGGQLHVELSEDEGATTVRIKSAGSQADPATDAIVQIEVEADRVASNNEGQLETPGEFLLIPSDQGLQGWMELRTAIRANLPTLPEASTPTPQLDDTDRISSEKLHFNDEDQLVQTLKELGDWTMGHTEKYRAKPYLEAAHDLMQFDEDKRIRVLTRMGKERLEGQLIVLCRMLFEPKPNGAFRRPYLGAPMFVGTRLKKEQFPLEPIAMVDGVPLLVVRGYALGGRAEASSSYLAYCLKSCVWTNDEFTGIESRLDEAYGSIGGLDIWGESLDASEWQDVVRLMKQIKSTVLIRIDFEPGSERKSPRFLFESRVGFDPEELKALLNKEKVASGTHFLLQANADVPYAWVAEVMNAIQEAGYRNLLFGSEQDEEQDDDSGDYGPLSKDSSLRLKLTLDHERAEVGQPPLARLEIKNFGDEATSFDPQYYAPFRVVRITDELGKPALFKGTTPQTIGFDQVLKPGEKYLLWEDVDLTELYLLKAGEYDVSVAGPVVGNRTLPKSRSLRMQIAPREMSDQDRWFQRLYELKPKDWSVSTSFNAYFLSHTPTSLKKDATTVQIWFTEKPLEPDFQLGQGEQRQVVTRLGETELGYLNLAAPRRAREIWADYEAAIRDAATTISIQDQGQDDDGAAPTAAAERELPWKVTGRVTGPNGRPMAEVEVVAYTGVGSLRRGGATRTDANGDYVLRFGPGVFFKDEVSLQAATISVHHDGYCDKDLGRQGDLLAAFKAPKEVTWGDRTIDDVVLPDVPRVVDFSLRPTASFRGDLQVVGELANAEAQYSVSLTGKKLPPSSSVAAQVVSTSEGEFELNGIPTGFPFQLLVEPKDNRSPWLAWASPPMEFARDQQGKTQLIYRENGEAKRFSLDRLTIELHGSGVNWKQALKQTEGLPLRLRWKEDGQADERPTNPTQSGRLWLSLGEIDTGALPEAK